MGDRAKYPGYLSASVCSVEEGSEELKRSSVRVCQLIVLLLRQTFERLCKTKSLIGEGADLEAVAVLSVELGHYMGTCHAIEPRNVIGVLRLGAGCVDVIFEDAMETPRNVNKNDGATMDAVTQMGLKKTWDDASCFRGALKTFRKDTSELDERRVDDKYKPAQWGVVDFITKTLVMNSGAILTQTKDAVLSKQQVLALLVLEISGNDAMPRLLWHYNKADFAVCRGEEDRLVEPYESLTGLYGLSRDDVISRLGLGEVPPAPAWLGELPVPESEDVVEVCRSAASRLRELLQRHMDIVARDSAFSEEGRVEATTTCRETLAILTT